MARFRSWYESFSATAEVRDFAVEKKASPDAWLMQVTCAERGDGVEDDDFYETHYGA